MTSPSRAVLAVAVAVAACALPVRAVAAPPSPACLGTAIEDVAGDQAARVSGATVVETGPNTDVIAGFFKVEGGRSYAHIVVTDLSRDMPQQADLLVWMVRFKSGSADNWVAADLLADGTLYFSYGHYEGTTLVEDGRIDGEFAEGPRGVIRIPVPASHGGAPGSTLTDPWIRVYGIFGYVEPAGMPVLSLTIDRAPDEGFGRTTKLAECGAPGAPATPAPAPVAAGGPSPETSLPVRVLGGSRFAPARRGARLRLRLRADEPVTELRVTVRRGGRIYAAARIAHLAGERSLRLAVTRAMRPGRYRLELQGTDRRGREGRQTIRFRVRRGAATAR